MWTPRRGTTVRQPQSRVVTIQSRCHLPRSFPTIYDLSDHARRHGPAYRSPATAPKIHRAESHQIQKIDISRPSRVSMATVSTFEYIARTLILEWSTKKIPRSKKFPPVWSNNSRLYLPPIFASSGKSPSSSMIWAK